MDDFLEIIGQALEVFDEELAIEDQETRQMVLNGLDILSESYVIVPWPESQELMEQPWFQEEAVLDVECKFGSSAYFVPAKYLIK